MGSKECAIPLDRPNGLPFNAIIQIHFHKFRGTMGVMFEAQGLSGFSAVSEKGER
jgi:hypothetical protein